MSDLVLDSRLAPEELLRELREVFTLEVGEESRETLTYRDTFDWRLQEAGLILTTSEIGRRARVALMSRNGTFLASVVSKTPRFAGDLPPGTIRERVHATAGHRRLLPRARAEWKGTLLAVLNEDGKTVVRLLLREGVAFLPDDPGRVPLQTRLRPLPLKGYKSEERRVTSFLRKTLGLVRDSRTEFAAVCVAVGQIPGDYSSSFSLSLDPRTPAAEGARQIHHTLLMTLLANREGITRDWDSEFLHDFRVAVRRTRSALSQLKGVFQPADVDHFLEEFRWLGSRTGPVRDIDVYLLNIPMYRAALHPEARKDLEPLVRLLRERRREEYQRLRRCLRSRRFNRLMEDWTTFLEHTGTLSTDLPNAVRPIREIASERIWRVFNKVLKKVDKISRDDSADALHRLRIECKKLRYLITFFRSLYPGEPLGLFIKELKGLQDQLGDFNDLQVQRTALMNFAEEMMSTQVGPPATLLAMGQLMGQLEGKQILRRETFQQQLGRFSSSENQKRFREIFGPKPTALPRSTEGEALP